MASARHVVLWQERSACDGLDAEHRKVVAGHRLGGHPADAAVAVDLVDLVDLHRGVLHGRDVAEDVARPVADVLVVRVGQRTESERGLMQIDVHDLVGPIDRRVAEDDGVDEAEDRRVGANANGQR